MVTLTVVNTVTAGPDPLFPWFWWSVPVVASVVTVLACAGLWKDQRARKRQEKTPSERKKR